MNNTLGRSDEPASRPLSPDVYLTTAAFGLIVSGLVCWKLASLLGARLGASLPVTVAIGVALFVAALVATALIARAIARGRAKKRKPKGFADDSALALWASESSARTRGQQTRPTLSPRQLAAEPLNGVGFHIAETLTGAPVVLSLEDHAGVCAPTGSGKTSGIMVAAANTAPGPTIITATRAELLDLTAQQRRRRWGSRPWVFDPLNICSWPHGMFWNPVPACVDAERAESLATAFIFAGRKPGAEPASGNAEFFNKEAAGILKVLLHAAALADKNMSHVVFWAKNVADRWDDAAEIIRSSDDPRAERSWVDDLRNSATGTSKSTADTQKTLQQLISPVATTAKLAWLTPSPERVEFDPSEFVTARDTLYIVCDSNRPQNLAPLCAMLLQAVVDAGKQAAAHTIAGRLDPPMRLCGDELTNVAPLPTFPDLLSDARGWGLQVIAAWQSDAQLKQRWGDNGAAIINDNLTVEVILPGVRDTDTLARVSKLVGEVSVVKSTHTVNGTGAAASVGAQTVEKVVLRADEIRRLGEHHPDQALLVHRTMSAVMVRLPRWFDGPDAITLRDDQAALADARRTYARASNA